MVKILIDTSIFINYLRTQKGPFLKLIDQATSRQALLLVPTVVIYEFWTGQSLDQPQTEKVATALFESLEIIPLTTPIAKLAGQLQRHGLAKGIDALIAATCLDQHAQLATLNRKHFTHIPHLQLWSPPAHQT